MVLPSCIFKWIRNEIVIWNFSFANLAFYGVIFPNDKEAAFSNQRLWNSIAFATAFGYSTFLCVDVKLYIMISVLLAGVSGYVTIEVYEYRKPKNGIQKDLSIENKNSSVVISDSKDNVSIEKNWNVINKA